MQEKIKNIEIKAHIVNNGFLIENTYYPTIKDYLETIGNNITAMTPTLLQSKSMKNVQITLIITANG